MAPLPTPKDNASNEINLLAEIFEQTSDPAAAWRSFHLARKFGLELPEPIESEIDRFAEAVASIADKAADGDTRATLDAESVGKLWKGHGGRDAGNGTFRSFRSFRIAVAIEKKKRSGKPVTDATALVAKEFGVAKTLAENARKQHSEIKDMGDDELGLPVHNA